MSLRLIASYDDLVQLCGLDTKLANKYTSVMEQREITFDPIMACASNPDLLVKGHFFSRKGKECKRSLNTFDSEKFTKKFIKLRAAELAYEPKEAPESAEGEEPVEVPEDKNKPQGVVRSGFDAYSYLMAYEREINDLYKDRDDLTKLQKAALYFVESGSEEIELDYVKYLASYDDLSMGSVDLKPNETDIEEWLPECGKWHYENDGRAAIMSGTRPVTPFFDAIKYIASYPTTYDSFKSEDGTLNEMAATVAWITFGVSIGLSRNQFSPMVYLANNPDLCKEDIYTGKEVDENKVAKKWLDNFSNGIDLSVFDVEDFKESNELKDDEDPFKIFVDRKVKEFQKELKKSKSPLKKLGKIVPGMPKLKVGKLFSCTSSRMKQKVDSPVEEEKLINNEEVVQVVEEVPVSQEAESVTEPEPELSLEELQQQLKETQDKLAVFDTKQELEAARKKLQKLESKKK